MSAPHGTTPRRRRPRDAAGRLARRARRALPTAATVSTTARLSTAGVLAYLLTLAVTDGPVDLTGALTALLVIQTSAHASARMALVRVGAVLTGVLVAVALSTWSGLTWWSLGLAIAASLLLASALRLGQQALETPISAMLVLAVGGQEIAAETRVVTTLVGAGVGVVFTVLLPPPVPTRRAVAGVGSVAAEQAECLLAASTSMSSEPITREQVAGWLARARRTAATAEDAAEAIRTVKDVRRLNARSIGSADVEPALRTGLEALDHSALAVRSLFVVMLAEAPQRSTPDDGYGEEVRQAFAVVLAEVAGCLRAFGELVQAETVGAEAEVERTLAQSLEEAREARAILTELLFVDPRAETSLWLLRGSILTAVQQVLTPLDLEGRARRRPPPPPAALRTLTPLVRKVLPTRSRRRVRALLRRGRRTWRALRRR
ncbi:FUSC family protein [Kineococcus indalonis]|uniref:FUSC family protein n=1 Tax=Kineococcus indalonis TaxID=2696566 RepID=UPI0014124063|nr:FUSC family protein [Kineococcus indalonis]NAZ84982.1 FUSC family protein [Kineococcus indalonis]